MARMYPNRLTETKICSAEYDLYHLFQNKLDNSYIVFHGVAWQSIGKNGRPQDGEADFVIVHPNNGVLVVEVKGGSVKYDPSKNAWSSVSEIGNDFFIKDPFAQARKAKYTLIDLLQKVLRQTKHINIGHAVGFPDAFVADDMLGADKPREIVMDMADTADISQWVGQAMAYWRGQNNRRETAPERRTINALMHLLGKTRELRPVLWGEFVREQAEMIELTQEQYVLLDLLNRQRRVAIAGCAGSGKTLLAMEKAVRLAQQGFRVLLTCYNRNLVSFLTKRYEELSITEPSVRDNLVIKNFHKLCFDQAREAQILPIQTNNQAHFYSTLLPEALFESTELLPERFDAIIVDEGQDFESDWWLPLQALLNDPENGILYIFYDDNQQIYGRKKTDVQRDIDSELPILTAPFTLTINCRNTRTIHKQVSRFYSAETATTARGPQGRPVSISRYQNENNLHAALTDTIRHLTRDEQIPPHEITILTPLSRRKSNLWLSDGFRGVRYTDKWPAAPEQVHCNTIHAFKGLESTVVILAEVDRWSSRPKDLDPLLYVACSRAKNHLVVLLPDSAPPVLKRRFA